MGMSVIFKLTVHLNQSLRFFAQGVPPARETRSTCIPTWLVKVLPLCRPVRPPLPWRRSSDGRVGPFLSLIFPHAFGTPSQVLVQIYCQKETAIAIVQFTVAFPFTGFNLDFKMAHPSKEPLLCRHSLPCPTPVGVFSPFLGSTLPHLRPTWVVSRKQICRESLLQRPPLTKKLL